MEEFTLICNPGKRYKGLNKIIGASELYMKLAFEDYDSLVRFHKDYEPFMDHPDYEQGMDPKEGWDLNLIVFAQQPVIRVGNIKQNFISTSYLFNPGSKKDKLKFPDLDVIEIEGNSQVGKAVDKIFELYDSNKWRVHILPEKIKERMNITPNPNGYAISQAKDSKIDLADPHVLREIARQETGYSLDRLCFYSDFFEL